MPTGNLPTRPQTCKVESTLTLHEGERGETGPLYTRILATNPDGQHQGALLLTAEVYRNVGERGPVFPVWRSTDNGMTWERIGDVPDTRFGWGNRYQPMIYELKSPFAGLEAGTLLLAGSSIPADLSETHLVIYQSVDGGVSWTFCSEIDAGGPADYDPGAGSRSTAIWEPHLDLIDDVLVCYYADERYKNRDMLQTLVHRTTTDLLAWTDRVLDFGVSDRFIRPGMFVSTGRLPDGTFRAVLEIVGPREVPIYFARSDDGLNWGPPDQIGTKLTSESGTTLVGTPNISWRENADGRIGLLATGRLSMESDGTLSNNALYNPDRGEAPWTTIPLPIQAPRELEGENSGYSQSVVWAADGALVHATTVRNSHRSHDIVVARAVEA